jgi:hypothetical protein
MSSTTFGRSTVNANIQGLRGPLLILGVSIVGFAISRHVMTHLGQWSDVMSAAAVASVFAVALGFRKIRYTDISAPLRIVIRCIGIIVLLQVLFDALGPFAGPPNIVFSGQGSVLYFRYAAILGLTAGIAALWRPSFLAPLFLYYVGWRELIGTLTGIKIVETDYLGMIDVGYFGILGAVVVIVATSPWVTDRVPALKSIVLGIEDRDSTRTRAFNLIWACAIGVHLGSYFWSAMAKIKVGGGDALLWLLHNPTQTAIVIGMERGDNPLMKWPHLVQLVSDGIVGLQPYLNIFVFGTQLLAPLAVISVPVLSVFCLLFDLFHIGVYLTLGALFFFWIALNLVIVASASSLPRKGFTLSMKFVMLLTILFGHYIFYTNHLGWLDSAKLASPQFYAITRDNRQVLVPSNYFGIYSYTIAQAAMYIPDGHFPFRLAGNSLDPKDWEDARTCGPQIIEHQDTGVTLDTVKQMVLYTDQLMRHYPMVKNDNLYYLYPHHMLPNPWVFTDFNDLRIEDIVAYEYVMDSVCLSLKDGELARDVHKHSVFRFDLR